jgi:5'-methylthioadenosine phosphorylase
MNKYAIIGGTGAENLLSSAKWEDVLISTSYGDVLLKETDFEGERLTLLLRHGEKHQYPPHLINYRANILALRNHGVTDVFAANAVGSLRIDLPPESLVLLSDFIDFTHGRPLDLGETVSRSHTDCSEPYSKELRSILLETSADTGAPLFPRTVYLCTNGPRYESPAEVRLFGEWGADVVGMTGLPEAYLAKEANMRYACVAVVTNYAAGLDTKPIRHEDVEKIMRRKSQEIFELFLSAIRFAKNSPSK